MKKLVVLDGRHHLGDAYSGVARLCEAAGVAFEVLGCETTQDMVEQAADADACLCNFIPMGAEVLSKLPRLKLVVRCGVGVDNLDIDAFTEAGVIVCNVPDYGVEEVAVHGLALMLSLERKVTLYNRRVHQGIWDENESYAMRRLSHQTLGFLGYGRIARKIASLAESLYQNLIAYDPYLPADKFWGARQVDLDGLFRQSDSLIVMAPATDETYHIVNAENLAKAKKCLRLVNVSRGALVDVDAVIEALETDKIAAAAFDVLETEPPTVELAHKLDRNNVILTPHVAYRSNESLEALKTMSAETALYFLAGNQPYHVINSAVMDRLR